MTGNDLQRFLHTKGILSKAIGVKPSPKIVGDILDMHAHGLSRAVGVPPDNRVDDDPMLHIGVTVEPVAVRTNVALLIFQNALITSS